jgi:3-(3-hydroxy-phenyl)propionate hydroxylase
LRDAANLAWKLAAVVKGKFGPALLDSYEAERRDHAWTMIRFAVRMGYLISPDNAFIAALTRFVFRASRLIPPLRDWLVQMRFKPKPRFKEGFFARSGQLSEQLCGHMMPQPMIERGATTMRLDDVLGPGFSILCFGQNPAALANGIKSVAGKFGANVVGCLPRNYAFAVSPFEPLIRDSSGEIGRFLHGSETAVMVVRPDRYVAAAFSERDMADAADVASHLIEATFAKTGA